MRKPPKPLNVQCVAQLLAADAELEDMERALRREGQARKASRVGNVRALLARAMAIEQQGIYEKLLELV